MTASLLVLFVLVASGATRVGQPQRRAFPKQEQALDAAHYWHGRFVKAHRLAGRFERQRNRARAQLRRIQRGTYSVGYAIRLASVTYGVSSYELHRVASCESGHDPYAANGQYRGVFQEGSMFERGPFGAAGFSVWDPIANVMTAAYTVSRQGWRQWQCQP